MTRGQLAEKIGKKQKTIENWMQGRPIPATVEILLDLIDNEKRNVDDKLAKLLDDFVKKRLERRL